LLREVIQSLRPLQWYKNLVVFIAIIFSYNLFSFEMWLQSIFAFIVFSFISGSVYIINDINDAVKDQLHPKKRFRPIASGNLSCRSALVVSIIILFISLSTSFMVNRPLGYIGLLYLCINLVYTFYLKYIALIDVMVLASDLFLRAIAGTLAIGVNISPWLILCVFLMAFVLAFGKGRHELLTARAHETAYHSTREDGR
jgi:4-hydroxybenzoate polyprenyltransferase